MLLRKLVKEIARKSYRSFKEDLIKKKNTEKENSLLPYFISESQHKKRLKMKRKKKLISLAFFLLFLKIKIHFES